jgi:hypothetical protein
MNETLEEKEIVLKNAQPIAVGGKKFVTQSAS